MPSAPAAARPVRRGPVPPSGRALGVVLAGPVAVLLAVVAVLVAAAFAGALAPPSLRDPGAVVRWGLPVVDVLAELAVAVAVGGAVLGAFLVPPGLVRRCLAVAGAAAAAWAVLAVIGLVLQYGATVGLSPADPAFGAQLGVYVTDVPLGRIQLTVVLLAALTSVVALAAATHRGALWTVLCAVAALALLSQTGHAAGSESHELAMSAMVVHLIGAAVWIGTLGALAVLWSTRAGRAALDGRTLGDAVARFSPMAAWCAALVGASGLVSATLRLGGVDGLTSRYGLLVVVKALLLAALAGVGWAHRRQVVSALRTRPGRPAAPFWRLVAVELALMGLVSGVAVALAATDPEEAVPDAGSSGRPTPAQIVTGHLLPPEPTWSRWITEWRWDFLVAAGCAAALLVYGRWVLRLRRRGDHWPVHRTIVWTTGILVMFWATNGGAARYGHVLFSAHMIQHMVLAMVVPLLLVLAAPVTLAVRALPPRRDGSRGPREWLLGVVSSRVGRFLAHPVVAAVNFAGSMIVFYYTRAFELSLTTYAGHVAMIVHFTAAGYLFANALIGVDPGPRRPPYPQRLLLLFATMAFHAFFGVVLVSGETLLVPEWFGLLGREWGPSAIEDQQLGGAVAWGIGEIPTLLLAVAVAVSWARDDERAARRRDRRVERDGDAELDEYNEMLARMSGRGRADDGS